MPESFDRCIKRGGKVRTRKLSRDRYQKICILNGQVYPGHIEKKKKDKKK
jgi:hypothetical protein